MAPLYLEQAYKIAEKYSDSEDKIGACLVLPCVGIISVSANVSVAPASKKEQAIETPIINCLFSSLLSGIQTEGSILYSTYGAFPECVRAAIRCKVRGVVYHTTGFNALSLDLRGKSRLGVFSAALWGLPVRYFNGEVAGKV